MSRRKWLLAGGLAAMLMGALIFALTAPASLTYRGKPANYWISNLWALDSRGHSQVEEFLFAAGPEVVPTMIDGLKWRENWASRKWKELYFKHGLLQRHFDRPIDRTYYRACCAGGLGILGPAAAEAVPALLEAIKDSDSYVRRKAIAALSVVATNKSIVLPLLTNGLSSTDEFHRLACVVGLTHCLPGNPQAAEVLRSLAEAPDSNDRAWAMTGLGQDDTDPAATLAVLIEGLSDTNAGVRGVRPQA